MAWISLLNADAEQHEQTLADRSDHVAFDRHGGRLTRCTRARIAAAGYVTATATSPTASTVAVLHAIAPEAMPT